MKSKRRWVQLSPELERLAMCAVIKGVVPETDVHVEELSKIGKVVLHAIENIREGGGTDEINQQALLVAAAEIIGADSSAVKTYLSSCLSAGATLDVRELLRVTREKCTVVDVLNEAGQQLASGKLDVGKIEELTNASTGYDCTLTSISDQLKNGIPKQPVGVRLKSLPTLSEASGGLMGMWAIAAEAGVGKSSLTVQLIREYSRVGPVLLYDMENGAGVTLYRIGKHFNMDLDEARRQTRNIFYRDSIKTLNADLKMFRGQKCLIVVDSLQKLPASVEKRRESIGAWVYRLESLKKNGHTILIVSEKSREQYGKVSQAGFKESGEVEYTADFGFQLIAEKDMPEMCKVIIVKNRHRPVLGQICSIERVNGFSFAERA